MKPGYTGTFFRSGNGFELGQFFWCQVISIHPDCLLVELLDGEKVEIEKSDFSPLFIIDWPEMSRPLGLPPAGFDLTGAASDRIARNFP